MIPDITRLWSSVASSLPKIKPVGPFGATAGTPGSAPVEPNMPQAQGDALSPEVHPRRAKMSATEFGQRLGARKLDPNAPGRPHRHVRAVGKEALRGLGMAVVRPAQSMVAGFQGAADPNAPAGAVGGHSPGEWPAMPAVHCLRRSPGPQAVGAHARRCSCRSCASRRPDRTADQLQRRARGARPRGHAGHDDLRRRWQQRNERRGDVEAGLSRSPIMQMAARQAAAEAAERAATRDKMVTRNLEYASKADPRYMGVASYMNALRLVRWRTPR